MDNGAVSTGYPFLKGHGTENDFVLLPDHDGSVHGDLDADAGPGAVRPARRHRRRRRAAGDPHRGVRRQPGRGRRVVHGLPQLRRLGQRDVRQRDPGLRAAPRSRRAWPTRPRRSRSAPATGSRCSRSTATWSPPTWGTPRLLGETDGVGRRAVLARPPHRHGQPARGRVRRRPRRRRRPARRARRTTRRSTRRA